MLEVLKEAADNPPPLLSHTETLCLIRQAQHGGAAGHEAMDEIIRRNVRLVLKTAWAYRTRATPTTTQDDIISAALIGLWNAVRLFDPDRQNRLSTYAVQAMKRSIQRTLANEALEIRIPVNRQSRISQINRATAKFVAINGRSPNDSELEQLTGLSRSKIKYALKIPSVQASIDDPIGDRATGNMSDVIPAPAPDPEPAISKTAIREAVEQILPKNLAAALTLRYGLRSDELSTSQIAAKLGLSKQRIVQMLATARETLRTHPEFVAFRDDLDL